MLNFRFQKQTINMAALMVGVLFICIGAHAPVAGEPTATGSQEAARIAGVVSAVSELEASADEAAKLQLEKAEVTMVAATTDQVEPDTDDEYDEWADKVMTTADEYMYIRKDDSKDSEVVGKLRSGDIATLIEVFDGWYEIESGNAHGYVSADYCVTGIEAYELAMDVCPTFAVTDVAGLRIREEATEDAKILKVVPKGTKLTVDTDAEEVEGWTAVKAEGVSGYVKADYVQIDMETGEAITIEEEQAAKEAAEAEAKAAKEAAEKAAAQKQSVIAAADDVALLAAIIQIEAGNESYEGKVAVGAVVMNRVKSGAYPNNIHDVIFARGQFSTSRMSSVLSKGPSTSCIQAAQEAIAGNDVTGGLTHFRRKGNKEGLIIGNHVFY